MNITQLMEISTIKDEKAQEDFASRMLEEAEKAGDFPVISETLLLRAGLAAQKNNLEDAMTYCFSFLETMENRIPDFLYIRGKIFISRLLLKSGDRERALEIHESLRRQELCQIDPLLFHDISLMEVELKIREFGEEKETSRVLLSVLEQYVKSRFLVERIFGRGCTDIRIHDGRTAIELLLDRCTIEKEHDRYFYWLEYEKLSRLCTHPLASVLPLKGLSDDSTERLKKLDVKLHDSTSDYRAVISALYQQDPGKKYESSTLREAAKHISYNFECYMAELEQLCLISPMNDISRGVLPLLTSKAQGLMDDKRAFITFLETGRRIYGGMISQASVRTFSCAAERDGTSQQIKDLYGMFRNIRERGDRDYKASAQKLYSCLFEPLEKDLITISNLSISPDGTLYALPFHQLWNGRGYLGALYAISLFPSLQSLIYSLWNSRESFLPQAGSSDTSRAFDWDRKKIAGFVHDEAYHIRNLAVNEASSPLADTIISPKGELVPLEKCYSSNRPLYFATLPAENSLLESPADASENLMAMLYLLFSMGTRCACLRSSGTAGQEHHEESLAMLTEGTLFGDFNPMVKRGYEFYRRDPVSTGIFLVKDDIQAPPLLHNNVLLIGGRDFRLYAFNVYSGELLWKYKSGDWLTDQPVCENDTVYLGGIDRRVRALSLATGRVLWEYRTSGWIIGPPRISGNHVYAASRDNNVYIIEKNSGTLKHVIKMEGKINAPLWCWTRAFVVSTSDGKLTAFSTDDYQKVWEKPVSDPAITTADAVGDHFVYGQGQGRCRISSLMRESGREGWQKKTKAPPLSIERVRDGRAAVLLKGGELVLLEGETGTILWTHEDTAETLLKPFIGEQEIILQSKNRELISLSLSSGSRSTLSPPLCSDAQYILTAGEYIFMIDREGRLVRTAAAEKPQIGYVQYLKSKTIEKPLTLQTPVYHGMLDSVRARPGNPEKMAKTQAQKKAGPERSTMEIDFITPPFVYRNSLVCGTSAQKIVAINLGTFERLWEAPLNYGIFQPPAVYKNSLIATDICGVFYLIDPARGSIIKKFNVCLNFTSPPLIDGDRLFIGADGGMIYCISIPEEKVIWKRLVGKAVRSAPLLCMGSLYVLSRDGTLLRFNPDTGKPLWEVQVPEMLKNDLLTQGKVLQSNDTFKYDMIPCYEQIIITGNGSIVYSLERKTGKLTWHHMNQTGAYTGAPILIDDVIIMGVKKGEFLALDYRNGNVRWRATTGDPVVTSPICHERTLYIGTLNGNIMSYSYDSRKLQLLLTVDEPVWFPLSIHGHDLIAIEGTNRIRRFSLSSIPCSVPTGIHDAREPVKTEVPGNTPEASITEVTADNTLKDPESRTTSSRQTVNLHEAMQKHQQKESLEKMIMYFFALLGLAGTIASSSAGNTMLLIPSGILLIMAAAIYLSQLVAEHQHVKSLMSRFVPPSFLSLIPGSEQRIEKDVTVLFQDLYNYTSISESLSLDELYSMQREVDDITNDIITRNGGEIMSYIGDAQMVVFNAGADARNHALLAVKSAVEIHHAMKTMADRLFKRYGTRFNFDFKMGFGINSGQALIGFRGGKNKMEPFVMGDTTNVAVRLQKLTRDVSHNILISESTKERLNGYLKASYVGTYGLKGKKAPTRTYAIRVD